MGIVTVLLYFEQVTIECLGNAAILFLGCKTKPEVENSTFYVYGGREASSFIPHHHCWGRGFKPHNEFEKLHLKLVC